MSTLVKADASGAVTLPADLCRAAGVEPGTDLVAEVEDGRIVIQRPRLPIWERIAALTADAVRRYVLLGCDSESARPFPPPSYGVGP
jgi:antitoxin component of MazEF toxin-antitoxin module